jgi:hypothetical protein
MIFNQVNNNSGAVVNVRVVTASDEKERCCVLDDKGENRCTQKARFWVGKNGLDDYTHVCGDHVEDVKAEGDRVYRLSDWQEIT